MLTSPISNTFRSLERIMHSFSGQQSHIHSFVISSWTVLKINCNISPSTLVILFFFVLMAIVSSEVTTITSEEYGITDLRKERLMYKWTIKHFSLLPKGNGEWIDSPIFRTENKDVEWRLRIHPRGDRKDMTDYVSVYLMLHSQKADKINVKVHAELTLLKSNHVHANHTFDITYNQIIEWGAPKFILRSTLLHLTSLDDTFTISAEVDMPLRITTGPFTITDSLEQQMSRDLQKSRLNDNFGLLLDEAKFSDVVILVGMDKFPAHKLVLSTRSSVFESIFEANQKSPMGIEKMEPIVMKATLEFIYDDNAANILVLTDLHRSYKLKERVIEFIADHLSAVGSSTGDAKQDGRARLFLFSVPS